MGAQELPVEHWLQHPQPKRSASSWDTGMGRHWHSCSSLGLPPGTGNSCSKALSAPNPALQTPGPHPANIPNGAGPLQAEPDPSHGHSSKGVAMDPQNLLPLSPGDGAAHSFASLQHLSVRPISSRRPQPGSSLPASRLPPTIIGSKSLWQNKPPLPSVFQLQGHKGISTQGRRQHREGN